MFYAKCIICALTRRKHVLARHMCVFARHIFVLSRYTCAFDKRMSVQIFTNPKGAYAELNDMIAASDGDLYVTGYMRGTSLRFDDSFTMT